ncbi:ABC transporter substrate-binding protein [Aquamicrobium segne]|uniref:ABC transporter substrate-binding protein n=1 Tax=Aquamicrobium segne TaxID=469547 RepID=A0ABW0GYI9_9HYPH
MRFLSKYHSMAMATTMFSVLLGTSGLSAEEFNYAEAAKPYAGVTITVLDEVTPMQEALAKVVPEFSKETGIIVNYELMSHLDVINKGQADMLSRGGAYDGVMLHGAQMGPMLDAEAIRSIDDFVADPKLSNPDLDLDDLIQRPFQTLAFFKDKQYGFINWNYNQVYWARADLLNHAGEKAAFKEKYGYDLGPAQTLEQMRDISEFFTRKRGEELMGEPLTEDFYGVVLDGLKGVTSLWLYIGSILRNFGGDIVDAEGKPAFNTQEVVDSLAYWAELWKYSPPGTAEYSIIDVPTVMGNGIAAQTLAFSDFVLGVDKPGGSSLHGSFVYDAPPVKEGMDPSRYSADGEPSMIVITQGSKNPEATFLFLQWLIEKKQQSALFEAGQGGVPIRESSWAELKDMDGVNTSLLDAMALSLTRVDSKPLIPNYFQVMDVLAEIVQQVGLGTVSPEEGAAQGQAALERLCGDVCLLQ